MTDTTDRVELLIDRAVDRRAAVPEWNELMERAALDADVGERLVLALRDDAMLCQALAPSFAVADAVQVPRARRSLRRARAWIGWAAAFVFGILWLEGGAPAGTVSLQPAVATVVPPEDTLYNSAFLSELPQVLVSAAPTTDGSQLEVVYVRRLLERAYVKHVYELGEDEHGEATPLEVSLAKFQPPQSF